MGEFMELEQIFQHIDDNFTSHLTKIQEFLQTPCFSTENFGAEKCVEYLKIALDGLGVNPLEIIKSSRGNPIIYGEYNVIDADRTLLIYAKYDNVGVNVENWTYNPLEVPIVDNPPFGKCIYARGAHGGHAQPRAFLNTLESIKDTVGELPLNLLFVLEGDEELGSINLPGFVSQHKDRLKRAEAMLSPGAAAQDKKGGVQLQLSGPAIVYLELECSGEKWGKGPVKFDTHPGASTIVESPLWHMIRALGSMISDDGNTVLIKGFYSDVKAPTPEEDRNLETLARTFNVQQMIEEEGGLKQFAEGETNPKAILTRLLYRPGMYLSGLSTRPMVTPHQVLAHVNLRLRPEQSIERIIGKLRSHLDMHGFSDISIKHIGGYNWWRTDPNHRLVHSVIKAYARFGIIPEVWVTGNAGEPFSNFSGPPLNLPCVGNVALAHGSGGHSPDEYMVVEGNPPYMGLRELEKSYAAILYEYVHQ